MQAASQATQKVLLPIVSRLCASAHPNPSPAVISTFNNVIRSPLNYSFTQNVSVHASYVPTAARIVQRSYATEPPRYDWRNLINTQVKRDKLQQFMLFKPLRDLFAGGTKLPPSGVYPFPPLAKFGPKPFKWWTVSLDKLAVPGWFGWKTSIAVCASVCAYAIVWANDEKRMEIRRQKRMEQALLLSRRNPNEVTWMSKWWYGQDQAHKTVYSLIAANAVVFGLWHAPDRYVPKKLMNYLFIHGFNTAPISGILSTFSHIGLWHFGFNMIGLYTFGVSLHHIVGKDQFLAIYLGGGAAAATVSMLYKRILHGPHHPYASFGSLGASGAVYAVVASCVYLMPHMQLAFIFLPFYTFNASFIIPFMIGLDSLGLILNFVPHFRITQYFKRFFNFDFAAHLGGMAFGYLYISNLLKHLKQKRLEQQRLVAEREAKRNALLAATPATVSAPAQQQAFTPSSSLRTPPPSQ